MPSRHCPKCGEDKEYYANCVKCGTWEDFWLREENARLQNIVDNFIKFCFAAGESASVAENGGDIKEVSDTLLGKKWWGIGEKDIFDILHETAERKYNE